MKKDMTQVAIFGMGYVGCVTAACLVRDGHSVIGVAANAAKVAAVSRGEPPMFEGGLEELMKEGVRLGRLRATMDAATAVRESTAAIICVGTPTGPDESPDLRALEKCCAQIGAALRTRKGPYSVMIRSTVPPGTCEDLVSYTLSANSRRAVRSTSGDILVLSVPEFLREGTAIADYDDPPFCVIGGPTPPPEHAQALVRSLFGAFEDRTHWVSYRTAELLKNCCNAWHAVKVVFANEVGSLCQAVGIDGIELMRVFCEDRKLNISSAYMRPGLPFGGSCLPKDLRALLNLGRRYGVGVPQLGGTLRSNGLHIERTIGYIEALGRKKVGLEGLAFKTGTDDIRESPMVEIAERLLGRGYDLRIYDPLVQDSLARHPRPDLAHLGKLLMARPDRFLKHSEVLVRSRSSTELLARARKLGVEPTIVDLGRPPYRIMLELPKRPEVQRDSTRDVSSAVA